MWQRENRKLQYHFVAMNSLFISASALFSEVPIMVLWLLVAAVLSGIAELGEAHIGSGHQQVKQQTSYIIPELGKVIKCLHEEMLSPQNVIFNIWRFHIQFIQWPIKLYRLVHTVTCNDTSRSWTLLGHQYINKEDNEKWCRCTELL